MFIGNAACWQTSKQQVDEPGRNFGACCPKIGASRRVGKSARFIFTHNFSHSRNLWVRADMAVRAPMGMGNTPLAPSPSDFRSEPTRNTAALKRPQSKRFATAVPHRITRSIWTACDLSPLSHGGGAKLRPMSRCDLGVVALPRNPAASAPSPLLSSSTRRDYCGSCRASRRARCGGLSSAAQAGGDCPSLNWR